MRRFTVTRMGLGALALGLGAVVFLVAQVVHPANPVNNNPAVHPVDAARDYSSTAYQVADLLYLSAFVLLLLGSLAMYRYWAVSRYEPWAFLALLLSLTGIALLLAPLGMATFAFPVSARLYLHGQREALAVISAVWNGPVVPVTVLGWVLLALGSGAFGLLFGVRGVLYGLGLLFYGLVPTVPLSLRLIDGLWVAAGGGLIAWTIGQQQAAPTTAHPNHDARKSD